jgi:hypothetical protein
MGTLTGISAVDHAIEIQILNRREQFALAYTRALAWSLGILAAGLAGLWLLVSQYVQLLALAGLLALATLGTALYPAFYRKGQAQLGAYLALSAFLLAPGLSMLLVPGTALAAVWGFAAVMLMATLFLGRAGCLRFTTAVVVLEVIDVVLLELVDPRLFRPLDGTLNLIILLASGVILPPIVAVVIYRNIAAQEDYFRQTQRANREIEQRVAADRKQQQLLQQANDKLDRRALQLQAAAEVSRATGSILDPDELIQQVVDLTRERFDLYYVGLYLIDPHKRRPLGSVARRDGRGRPAVGSHWPPHRSGWGLDGGLVHRSSPVTH